MKKVVKRERERRRPGADEHDLDERVRELARGPPEAERAAKVFELDPRFRRKGSRAESLGDAHRSLL